ncbi:hypothetical protein FRC01_001144 [Tulasnella sp. 417]|nr:hypothetical protein FRC01_001144 [Tulasnella sp. 417]
MFIPLIVAALAFGPSFSDHPPSGHILPAPTPVFPTKTFSPSDAFSPRKAFLVVPPTSVAVPHHNNAGLSDRPISISTTVQVALNHVVADVGDAIVNLNFLGPQLPSNTLSHWWRKYSDRGEVSIIVAGNIRLTSNLLGRSSNGEPPESPPACHQNAVATGGQIDAAPQRSNAVLAPPPIVESASTFNPEEILAVAATTIHQPRPRPAGINTLVQTLEFLARLELEAQEGGVEYEGNTSADQGCGHDWVEATFGPPSGPHTTSPEPESPVADDNANVVEATLVPLLGSPHRSVDHSASSSRELNRESRAYQLVADLYRQHAAARAMEREPVSSVEAAAARLQFRGRINGIIAQARERNLP